jgi:TRAP-type C4-dicarboxylate transport system permease large subunit
MLADRLKKSISEVVRSVLPALGAIFIGTVILSWFPIWVTALPQFFLSTSQP